MAGKLKITKLNPKGGCTCGECGKFNRETEGSSETFRNGRTHFQCAYCGKITLLDWMIDPKTGNLVPLKMSKKTAGRKKVSAR